MTRMSSTTIWVLLAGLLCVVAPATAAEPTAVGLWEKIDDTGKPEGWFRIVERDGMFEGQIVKAFPKPGQDPTSWRCTKCEDDRKDAPVLGITFIRGMKRDGLEYEDGNILDPRDGSIYRARMELSPDGQQLSVRGFLGISLLGKTETWNRLPDDAMDEPKPDPKPAARPAAPANRAPPRPGTAAPR